jgi:hypothetical protein
MRWKSFWVEQNPLDQPVQLFHPAFGHFLDDISKEDPISDDINHDTRAYMMEASTVYSAENMLWHIDDAYNIPISSKKSR